MTKQHRQQIRAELARRMGWLNVNNVYDEWGGTVFPSRGYRLRGTAPGDKNNPQGYEDCLVPDPFTNAADKDALVKWLAAQSSEVQQEFEMILMSNLATEENCKLPVVLFWLTASCEAITLAAARALGIGEAEE